jgi:hypothetical protein
MDQRFARQGDRAVLWLVNFRWSLLSSKLTNNTLGTVFPLESELVACMVNWAGKSAMEEALGVVS